jgi:hypothetical protein
LLVALLPIVADKAQGHGSVVDGDQCLISIGFYRAEFSIYQPRKSGHDEFCEDLPEAGETVFVIEYLHDTMREVPLDFRIVRDRHQIGRFARYEDVLKLDLERDTVFYQPARVQSDAVFTVLHDFLEPGGYIGVITVEHPTSDEVYRAVFPFDVGTIPGMIFVWLSAGALFGVLLLWLWWNFKTGAEEVA